MKTSVGDRQNLQIEPSTCSSDLSASLNSMEVLLHSEETPILLLHFLKFCFCYFLNKNNKNEIRRKVYISYPSLFSTSLFPPVLWWRCRTPVRTDQERTLGTRACRRIRKYTAAVQHGNPREMVLALVSRSATDLAETFRCKFPKTGRWERFNLFESDFWFHCLNLSCPLLRFQIHNHHFQNYSHAVE